MRFLLGICFLLSLTSFADPPQTPAQHAATDKNQDFRRTTVIETMRGDLKKIEERRQSADTEYEAELKKLVTAREALRATHVKSILDSGAKLKTLDDAFQRQADLLRAKRTKVYESHTVKVAELDKEAKDILAQAGERYTEAVSKQLKAHDEKRKAQEAVRTASLASTEDERIAALNGYFDAISAHEQNLQRETQANDTAKAKQLTDHAKKGEEITQKYNDQLTALANERAKLMQKSTDQLYGYLEVPSRTVPPVVAGGNNASVPLMAKLPKGQTVEMAITYAGVPLAANDPKAVPYRDALNQILAGKYVAGFTFNEKGEILFLGKVLSVEFVYSVDGVRLALSGYDSLKLEQRLLSAVVQNLYRVPTEDFTALMYQPVDAKGQPFTYRQGSKIPAAIKAIMGDRKEELAGVTAVDEQTFLVEGTEVRIKWFRRVKGEDGKLTHADFDKPEELSAVKAKWSRALSRSLSTVSVPREVRAKLALPGDANVGSVMASALRAPARCQNHLFLQHGEGQVVIARRKDKVILFTALGVADLNWLACAENSVSFIGTGVRRATAGKFDLVKNPGADIKVADLVATDTELSSKDKLPTLFTIAGDTVKLGIVTAEGTVAKVSTVLKDKKATGYRVWAMDEKKAWITDFTIVVTLDAQTAAPDVGSKPEVAAEFSAEALK